jgi:hypothetical protein
MAAGFTFATGCSGHARLAIQTFRKDTGNGGLAYSTRSCKQIGMVQTIFFQGIDKSTLNMRLADQFREISGPPFPGQDLIAHEKSLEEYILTV